MNGDTLQTRQVSAAIPAFENAFNCEGVPLNNVRVDDSAVLTIVQGLKRFITDQLDLSFNKLRDEVRSNKDDMRKIREYVTQATSTIIATASSLLIKQQSASSRTKEIHK